MPTIRMDPKQFAAEMRRHAKEFPQAIARGARAGAMRGQTYMPKKTPTDMGQLRNSWRVRGGGLLQRFVGGVAAVLYNDAPHAGILESGARPHKVSAEGIEALTQWVLRHMKDDLEWDARIGRAKDKLAGKRGGTLKDRKYQAARGIAFAIAGKIEKYGQAPRFFVRAELEKLRAFMVAETRREIAKVIGGQP